MLSVKACDLPPDALLNTYVQRGAYVDCYFTDVFGVVSHAQYVEAFYTSSLFKVERLILKTALSRPSTDLQARELAAGRLDTFAAWSVEGCGRDQLLLADFSGRTKSWLMSSAIEDRAAARTRLYFGSAVVPVVNPASRESTLGFAFQSLLGFHKLYSRALLFAAASRLARRQTGGR